MADLADQRSNIDEFEVDFRSPVSERTFSKIGSSINHINNRKFEKHTFNLNGPINLFLVTPGVDGVFTFLFDAEITGYSQYIASTTGAGSSLILDVHRLTGGTTDSGSIFSSRPQIATTAANQSYSVFRAVDSTILAQPTGHSLGVLSTTNVDEGDALRFDLDQFSAMRNYSMNIFYRAR